MDAKVRASLPRADKAQVALERCARACRSAASAATSADASIRAGRDDLAGARVQRCESLLELARSELKDARTMLGDIDEMLRMEDDERKDAKLKKRWDTPPIEWWRQCADELKVQVSDALAAVEQVQKDWSSTSACASDGYTTCVQQMATDAERLHEKWTHAMKTTSAWRDIVMAVGDGLPASQSVIRKLPI